MRRMRKIHFIPMLILAACAGVVQAQEWTVQTTGIATNLRGLSAVRIDPPGRGPMNEIIVDNKQFVVWASGSNGVILLSEDQGEKWKQLHVDGGDALDFRGVRAFDAKTAYVMSSGEGEKSRIYKTTDGGKKWELQYTDKRPAFFLDDLVCLTATHCIAIGDPIDGKFVIVSTEDGKNWTELPRDGMPVIIPGEGVFAASGTSLALYGASDLYFGTGGGATARVFHSSDLGRTWTVADTPLAAGNASSGVFSIVRSKDTVVVVGGDYKNPSQTSGVAAYSTDRGATWKLASVPPGGYRSGLATVGWPFFIGVGPTGTDISSDGGTTWKHFNNLNLNGVAIVDISNMWAVGTHGTIVARTGVNWF
jgi:photosystem II stability/assembly factor-like uncharacterized protein